MSKLKLFFVIVTGLVTLNGCSNKVNQFKLEDVITAIETQGVKLSALGVLGNTLNLNNVIPEMYVLETPGSAEDRDSEYVYFYIFNSEKARNRGVQEFNNMMKNAKFTTFPFLYEKGNVLVIYWSKSEVQPLFDTPIKTALENLRAG